MKKVIFTSVLFCFVAFSASAQKQKTEELRKKQAATPPPSTAKLAVNANKTKPTDPASSFSDAVSKMPQQSNTQQTNTQQTNKVNANSKTGTTAPKVAAETKAKQN